MSPERSVPPQLETSIPSHKAQLIYKLFLLQSARNTIEEELYCLLHKACDEVQEVFHSTLPNGVLTALSTALDVKCSVLKNLTALLKDLTKDDREVGMLPPVKKGIGRNQLQLLRLKGAPQTEALKFWPMLKNSLMATSISKAVQVLGAMQSLQQLQLFFTPSFPRGSRDDTTSSPSPNLNGPISTTRTPCSLKTERKKAVFDEKNQEDLHLYLPLTSQTHILSAAVLPQNQATLPGSGSFEPIFIRPLTSWGQNNDFQVQHHRQTSSQLLHFLRKNTYNMSAEQVTVSEWNPSTPTLDSLELIVQRQVVKDEHVNGDVSQMSKKNSDIQAPVFRVKKKRASNSLITYSCVIMTETELWDIIDIPMEEALGGSELSHLEGKDCRETTGQVANFSVNSNGSIILEAKTQTCNSVNIPPFHIRKFEEAEVVVSHIVSPGNFFIQYADSTEKLQSLITEELKANSSFAENKCIPDLGTLVIGWFPMQNEWCRAQVNKICGVCRDKNASDSVKNKTSIMVEVKRLDHGDTACLSLWDIKQLTPGMTVLPLQAVQVSLANVVPVNGNHWSQESVSWFRALVHNRTLYARLSSHGTNITVEMFLEKGKLGVMRRGASLSLRLAQNGHAQHSKLEQSLRKRGTAQRKATNQN